MNQVSDLFMLEEGQSMTLSADTTLSEIYAEAAANDTAVSVTLNIYDQPVVTLSTDGKIADFARTLVMSELDSVVMTVPIGMKESSIKTSIYGLTQGKEFKYGVKFEDKKVKVTKSKNKKVNFDIDAMKIGEIVKVDTDNIPSTRVSIYRKAKDRNKAVYVFIKAGFLYVKLLDNKREQFSAGFHRAFINWVSSLKYGIPTEIPDQFKVKGVDYMRTCISKAGLDVLMTGDSITRQTAVLKFRKGVAVLRIKDVEVAEFKVNIGSRYVRKEHREKIDKLLLRTGLTYEDIK